MEVIDLYVKIANNEEVPKKIKLKNFEEIYTLREDCTGYKWYGEEKTNNDFGETIHENLEYILKQDIEILEEQKKIPEKLPDIRFENGKFYLSINGKQMYILREVDKVFLDKINSIIDYLESKGDE